MNRPVCSISSYYVDGCFYLLHIRVESQMLIKTVLHDRAGGAYNQHLA